MLLSQAKKWLKLWRLVGGLCSRGPNVQAQTLQLTVRSLQHSSCSQAVCTGNTWSPQHIPHPPVGVEMWGRISREDAHHLLCCLSLDGLSSTDWAMQGSEGWEGKVLLAEEASQKMGDVSEGQRGQVEEGASPAYRKSNFQIQGRVRFTEQLFNDWCGARAVSRAHGTLQCMQRMWNTVPALAFLFRKQWGFKVTSLFDPIS